MKIQESAENYLETILILSKSNKKVRSIDIANALDYSKPSVSIAMKNLRNSGHIKMDDDSYISLTESGLKIAEAVYERHLLISNLLISLGVPEDIATDDACKIEHILSKESFDALKKLVNLSKELKGFDF